jgi:3-hydroxyacyl-CoA dehydrogenase
MSANQNQVTLIGLGTIGISMAALHLRDPNSTIHLFDVRSDIEQHILAHLPAFLESVCPGTSVESLISSGRIKIHTTIETACSEATIIQEQGPENVSFKKSLWAQVESIAPPYAHFWSSTSGIPTSEQTADMQDKSRLLVVHPFNPPHIMPLLEIVPSPNTNQDEVDFACNYFRQVSPRHCPVVIKKEICGFVGNRLAFAVLREACYLVEQKVVSVKDLDQIMMSSLGPRWALNGVFESYNSGGGVDGFRGFLNKLEATVQGVWNDLGVMSMTGDDSHWKEYVISQTEQTYGPSSLGQTREKEEKLREVQRIQTSNP